MGQAAASCASYNYGQYRFTRSGYLVHAKTYTKPCPLEDADLHGRVGIVTGANALVSCEVAKYLASRGATVYMVCGTAEGAEQERDRIVESTKNQSVHVLVADLGLAAEVRRVAAELRARVSSVHCLVCNAGTITPKWTQTSEGQEVTFATHLLNGTYLLTEELRPLLHIFPGSRVVCVSSGGMYNVKYNHGQAAAPARGYYNAQYAYAAAKRGQVLLCEHWSRDAAETLKFVSCHPGWTDTPGVERVEGHFKSWMQPLRSPWEGAEGICWLCVAPLEDLESGAFYLDRKPQPKNVVSWTHNTPKEREQMAAELAKLASASPPAKAGRLGGAPK